ncbi:tetratricopeptide repeat protein [Mycobacterium manitobense]|uniref:Tetratricopeptide repeat protein n=1 Tax=[Mycobacterium] manitobense TaxID=190147 RepID=A0A9X2YQQ5_9MYCO|nr:tetratricopeptide repeat protein [[Mycobacterium] manitobense]MCV7172393.1 tetratricopeptide repeat protein [[Mycobacterium] manitobense]
MAGHADAAERIAVRPSNTRTAAVAGLVVLAALGGLLGWFGYQNHQEREAQTRRDTFVQVARQAAVNLTTVDHTDIDAAMQRILDQSTGDFHDEFQQRYQPFTDAVRQMQSTSEGTVTEAGLESGTADQADVLVTVSMTTTSATVPQAEPRGWRMRISVRQTDDGAKISNVAFVP